MKSEERENIKKALEERGVKAPCPRCGNEKFFLTEGYFVQSLQDEAKGIVIGGPGLPSVVVVCTHCGFISQHALGVLGLLDSSAPESSKTKSE